MISVKAEICGKMLDDNALVNFHVYTFIRRYVEVTVFGKPWSFEIKFFQQCVPDQAFQFNRDLRVGLIENYLQLRILFWQYVNKEPHS